MEDSHDTLRRLLAKDESWRYNELLPIKVREGEWDWALPDILRAPMQSWMDIRDSFGSGQLSTREGTEEMMPDALNVAPLGAGGIMRGMGRGTMRAAAQGAEGPINEALRWKKSMTDAELAAELDRVTPLLGGEPRSVKRPTHRDYSEDSPKNKQRAAVLKQFDELAAMKERSGIEDDLPPLPEGPWPTPDNWLPMTKQQIDDAVAELDRMLDTPNRKDINYQANLREVANGDQLDPVHAEWNRRYELSTGIKPPTHGGNSTLHEGSSLPALLSAILAEDDRR